jgi:hypothetical protein
MSRREVWPQADAKDRGLLELRSEHDTWLKDRAARRAVLGLIQALLAARVAANSPGHADVVESAWSASAGDGI